jgi:hypothetical protein
VVVVVVVVGRGRRVFSHSTVNPLHRRLLPSDKLLPGEEGVDDQGLPVRRALPDDYFRFNFRSSVARR